MGLRAKTTTAAVNSSGGGSKHTAATNNCKFLNGGKKLNKNPIHQPQTPTKQTAVTPATTVALLTKVVAPCLNCKTAVAETTCCSITSIRTTYRSSSTSALLTTAATSSSSSSPLSSSMRPQTLNVHNHLETPTDRSWFLNFIAIYDVGSKLFKQSSIWFLNPKFIIVLKEKLFQYKYILNK